MIGGIGDAQFQNLQLFLGEQLGIEISKGFIALLPVKRCILGKLTAFGVDLAAAINRSVG